MRGFTLIEALMALTLIILVLLAMVGLVPGSLASLKRAHDITGASQAAQQELEFLRSQPYASLANGTTTTNPTIDGITYQQTAVVSDASTTANQDVKQVTVTEMWGQAAPGGPFRRVFTTQIFGAGLP